MRRAVAGISALVTLTLMSATWAPAASAHAEVDSTVPRNGAVVRSAPPEIIVRFSEDVTLRSARVLDASGATIPVVASSTGATVRLAPSRPLPRGPITTAWQVVSDDGHTVTGSMAFIVGPKPGTGPSRKLEAFPRVPVKLSGSRPGLLTFTVDSPGAAGSVSWTHPQLAEPLIWPLMSQAGQMAGRGVLPLTGEWTYSATVSQRTGAVTVISGTANLAPQP